MGSRPIFAILLIAVTTAQAGRWCKVSSCYIFSGYIFSVSYHLFMLLFCCHVTYWYKIWKCHHKQSHGSWGGWLQTIHVLQLTHNCTFGLVHDSDHDGVVRSLSNYCTIECILLISRALTLTRHTLIALISMYSWLQPWVITINACVIPINTCVTWQPCCRLQSSQSKQWWPKELIMVLKTSETFTYT